jgi:hypothetical protein
MWTFNSFVVFNMTIKNLQAPNGRGKLCATPCSVLLN